MDYDLVKYVLFVSSFLISLGAVFIFSKINKQNGIIGIDINKKAQTIIPESTGVGLLIPLILGVAAYAYLEGLRIGLIAWIVTIFGFAAVGFLDDVHHKFLKQTIGWQTRAITVVIISLIFSVLYAPELLWAIPIAAFIGIIAGLQNTFAGLNGWEVGSGFIISAFLMLVLWENHFFLISVILCGAILGLLLLNKYPAKVFPGDSGTLIIGSAMSALVVLSGDVKAMLITCLFFIPHLFDFLILKMLTNPNDPSQMKVRPYSLNAQGKLEIPKYKDGKIKYDFAKLIIRIFGPLKEWQIICVIWGVVIANCLLWTYLFGYF
ncbi:MAG: hypothetical protein V1672_03730 [Candidatus Diapherotrites archaeon]